MKRIKRQKGQSFFLKITIFILSAFLFGSCNPCKYLKEITDASLPRQEELAISPACGPEEGTAITISHVPLDITDVWGSAYTAPDAAIAEATKDVCKKELQKVMIDGVEIDPSKYPYSYKYVSGELGTDFIKITAPPHAAGHVTITVTLEMTCECKSKTKSVTKDYTFGFDYYHSPIPVVTDYAPPDDLPGWNETDTFQGSQCGGTPVKIHGTGFRKYYGTPKVSFGNEAVLPGFISVNDAGTEISAITPRSNVVGIVPVTVTNGPFDCGFSWKCEICGGFQYNQDICANAFVTADELTTGVNYVGKGDFLRDEGGTIFNDVVVAGATYDGRCKIKMYRGDGSGFVSGDTAITISGTPTALTVGNFDGDRFPDIAITRRNGGLVVLLNSGDGFWADVAKAKTYVTGEFPNDVVTTDFNNDGVDDLVVSNQGSRSLSVYTAVVSSTGRLDGSFGYSDPISLASAPVALCSGNFDATYGDDIAVILTDSTVSTYLSIIPTSVTAVPYTLGGSYSVGGTLTDIKSGNFFGDALSDIAVLQRTPGRITLINYEAGVFTVAGTPVNLSSASAKVFATGEYDNDSRAGDFVVGYENGFVEIIMMTGIIERPKTRRYIEIDHTLTVNDLVTGLIKTDDDTSSGEDIIVTFREKYLVIKTNSTAGF